MSDLLKERYNIFKGVVALFDTKLSASVLVTLLLFNLIQFYQVKDLNKTINSDKDKMYKMVIEEVRKQVAPIKAVADSNKVTVDESSSKLDTMIDNVKNTLESVNNKIK